MEYTFPSELPITAHIDEIAEALRRHQVLIVCGDTGSGKTTQLPKIALKAGRGTRGLIGCTQPRRLAALAMARRVAEEFGQDAGRFVGYQHRFESRLSQDTKIKFMTDGILLAETRHDRLFRKYDTLIIDEAHERSLNIDFLLGILRHVLPRRPDLKLVVSSATLDVKRFSAFFGDAPVVSVPGRLHPIETRWRPPADADDPDLPRQIANAVDEFSAEGDILVFLPGERDIREAAEVLNGRRLPRTDIIPLLASLPAGEQQRAFTLSANRRIILSTNVAETSVTLPGIRYVIDSGLVRLSRYNPRTQVQRLQIESVSQASAEQRKGRCGRIAPGICIRLYDEGDFKKRDAYTPPEILRSSLAHVILTMMDLKLGDIETFPFIDAPGAALIREGYRELELLDAITAPDETGARRLTHLGRELARLPIDPAFARILFAAHHEKALTETLIVVAALECDDPRRRPIEKQAEADKCHARFLTANSDFAAFIRLWRWYREHTAKPSQSVARRLCKDNFLSYPKMRDWLDLHGQIEGICKSLGLDTASVSGGDAGLHRALLTGLLSNLAQRDPETNEYRGTRGTRFALFPGSGLVKLKEQKTDPRQPRQRQQASANRNWIIAGELVETSRLFARTAACIDPAWVEPIAKRHCKYSHHSAQWDATHGYVRVKERVTLFGLVLVESRTRDYSRINPADARAIMIREGLVAGAFPAPLPTFLAQNLARTNALLDAESKLRQHGALFDPDLAFAFYDARLPQDVCNAHDLRKWLATLDSEQLIMRDADLPPMRDLGQAFPDSVTLNGSRLALTYRHAPGEPDDGVTCTVPAPLLPIVAAWRSDWLMPGMLEEKLRWMLNVLPSKVRRLLQPYDETLAMCRSRMTPGKGALADAFAEAVYAVRGVRVPQETWREDNAPPHLRMRFLAVDADGKELGNGRNVDALARLFAPQAAQPLATATAWHRDGLTQWDFGDLPQQVDVGKAGWPVINYPALVDAQTAVSLRLFADAATAAAAHEKGVCRLFALALGKEWKRYQHPPSLPRAVTLYMIPLEMTAAQLGAEIATAALRETFVEDKPVIRDAQTFQMRLASERGCLHAVHTARARLVIAIIQAASEVDAMLATKPIPRETIDDVTEQLAWLVFPGFAEVIPTAQLQQLPRYLEACRVRIQRAQTNPAGDLRKRAEVQPLWQRYADFIALPEPPRHDKALLNRYRWLTEEFRVSTFAQELRTNEPVSTKRLTALWEEAMRK
ncbi:MAG: ATP-dependent RNA helicase HrpA [Kiritimatiellaeota bacterium]|nr:ATP-dependent RNA helicase HrpA [Kiritimatiellota bacterium]